MREEYDLNTRFYSSPKKVVNMIGRKRIQTLVKKLLNTVKSRGELVERKKDEDMIIEKYQLTILNIKIRYERYIFKNPITISNVFCFESIEDIFFLSKILCRRLK